MKTKLPLQTSCRALRNSLFYLWLLVLAIHLPVAVMGQLVYSTPYTITTLAGYEGFGSADGVGTSARFNIPSGVAVDSAGNLYVADSYNFTIRKVTQVGTNWVVSTLAGQPGIGGSADGTGSAAQFGSTSSVAVDTNGIVYVADSSGGPRIVSPAGVVMTLAIGVSTAVVAVDGAGNIYGSDGYVIYKVVQGAATIVAGQPGMQGSADGTGSAAQFNGAAGLTVDHAGNIYVADTGNATIRKVTPAGVVTTLAGLAHNYGTNDGTGSAALFSGPEGVAVDSAGILYVADDFTIRKVTPAGVVTTWVGQAGIPGSADGTGNSARFGGPFTYSRGPSAVAVDSTGNVYVTDAGNNNIRKVTPAGVVTTLAGLAGLTYGSADGIGAVARFNSPNSVAVDSSGNIFVADSYNFTIRKVTPTGMVTTLAGLAGNEGTNDGTGSAARFGGYFGSNIEGPQGVAADGVGNVYVADTVNNTIRKVTPAGVVTTLAGQAGSYGDADGTGSAARFNDPHGVAVDSAGNVYVAEPGPHTIRKVTPAGVVTTLAGMDGTSGTNDGTGSDARFDQPHGVAVDSAGNVYVADTGNSTIRKVTPARVVTTLAGLPGTSGSADGTGSTARFDQPHGVAVDSAGNVYVADSGLLRKVTPGGVVTTLAGTLQQYSVLGDGTGSAAAIFNFPGVAVDSIGNVYMADGLVIRKGIPASSVPEPILQPPAINAGQFGFGMTGFPGLAVDVESSGDLSAWQKVDGNYVLAGGSNYCVIPTPLQGNQFYRVHVR